MRLALSLSLKDMFVEFFGEPVIPNNTLLDDDSTPLVDDDATFLTDD